MLLGEVLSRPLSSSIYTPLHIREFLPRGLQNAADGGNDDIPVVVLRPILFRHTMLRQDWTGFSNPSWIKHYQKK